MEVSTFLSTMEKELMRNGFSRENARAHTLRIAKSLSPSDKTQISEMNDVGQIAPLAKNYARRVITEYRKTHPAKKPEAPQHNTTSSAGDVKVYTKGGKNNRPSPSRIPENRIEKSDSEPRNGISAGKSTLNTTTEILKVRRPEKKVPTPEVRDNKAGATRYVAKITTDTKVPLSAKGKQEYTKRVILNFIPILFGILLCLTGIFGVYVLIGILISLFVALLVTFAIAGVVSGLAGLIYGIIKLFTVMHEGLFEIGLSVIIFSVTLIGCIFLYNVSVRIVPILWKNFTGHVEKLKTKLRTHINMKKTECNSI